MKTKLQLTFRIVFFYTLTYIVAMTIMLIKSFIGGWRKASGELGVVWSKKN